MRRGSQKSTCGVLVRAWFLVRRGRGGRILTVSSEMGLHYEWEFTGIAVRGFDEAVGETSAVGVDVLGWGIFVGRHFEYMSMLLPKRTWLYLIFCSVRYICLGRMAVLLVLLDVRRWFAREEVRLKS